MALKIRKGRPSASAVLLPGGAVVFVRPATSFEVDRAGNAAARMLAGLVEGQNAAATALNLLGDEFREADFTTRSWLDAAAQRIALLELATLCVERWEGIVGDDDRPIEKPNQETLALLLRDSECARRISNAVNARVHQEIAEGNASAASPDGAVKAADATAPSAG